MPGYNHGEAKADRGSCLTNCVFVSTYYIVIILIVGLEAAFMLRYFFLVDEEWATSITCYALLLTAVVIDTPLFWSLTRAKREDPGYLIPSSRDRGGERLIDANTDDSSKVCKKCGVKKQNEQTHHCSRCGRCVDMMDHHCTVTNNCVGRKNMRYFIQFTAWGSLGLIIVFIAQMILFYTQNRERGVGVQGIGDLIIINPFKAYK